MIQQFASEGSPIYLLKLGSKFSRTKTFCFENCILLAFGLSMCEGVGENLRHVIHYKKITILQRIFPLQIRCKPIKIHCKSLLAMDLQQKCYVEKHLVAILHALAFGCKRPTDLQRNYFVVILQRISHPLLIQLLNPKNQKTMNKLKLLSFRCKCATDQQPFHY